MRASAWIVYKSLTLQFITACSFALGAAVTTAPGTVSSPTTTSSVRWMEVERIDCRQQPPASDVGDTRLVQSDLGAYREAGPRIGDRFVYTFKLSAPDRLVRATVTYPDDKMRAAGVSAWGPPQEALGSGFMCGEDVPLSQQMVKRQYVYYSRNQEAALVFSTEAPKQPVAIASLVIEETVPTLPPAPLPALSAKNHRRVGLCWEDPVLARCFGEPDSVDGDAFDKVVQRCMEYCRWSGLSEISYPAYWYTGPMFDSHVMPNYPIATRLHPPDALVRLAKHCDANEVAYVPALNVFKLRPLKDHTLDERQVIEGKPNINTVGSDGHIVTWDNAQFWRECVSVPLHPIVQEATRSLLVEIANQCAPYKSFDGIDLEMWPGTILKLGSSTPGDSFMSFDDYTVDAFCADSHLQPPGKLGEKERFGQRAKWLHDDPQRWQAWLKWRAEHMTKFYDSLAAELASIKPGAKLGICIYTAHGRPENESANVNDLIYAAGIDLDALSKNPNIAIKRYAHQMMPRWRLRNGMPRPKDLNVENTARFQAPFANRPGMGFIIHQQYFETKADINGDLLKLPAPFADELTAMKANAAIRVTEPLPSGRDYLRFFASAVRNYDPYSMAIGGYVLGTQGAELELREMATAFSALPAVRFEDVFNADEVVVRQATAEARRWAYAVNLTARRRSIVLSFRGDGAIANAVSGQPLAVTAGRTTLDLKPYELMSLCGPDSMSVVAAQPIKDD